MSDKGGFDLLADARYVSVTTFRRDGTPIATPMGPIFEEGRLYFFTPTQSGKMKRIRRNPRVEVAPCTMRGQVKGAKVLGIARILTGEDDDRLQAAFRRKWGLPFRLTRLIERWRRITRSVIEVIPRGPL